jgi:sugar/nucleoside kinase (ribokinase family)
MKHKRSFDVLGLGAVAVDDFIFVENYPPPDSKARVRGRQRSCGGLAATALIMAARLGGRCAYAGVLGRDALSAFVLGYLKNEGIDVSHVKRAPTAGPVYSNIVVAQKGGTRNIFHDERQAVGPDMRVPAALIYSCRVLLVDNIGVPGMVRAAQLARRRCIPVVADFEDDTNPRFRELLLLSNHLIISERFAAVLTGKRDPKKAIRALANRNHEVIIITSGAKGCWSLARGTDVPRHSPAFKVKAVDTTGCGDIFHGAYAFGLARDWPLNERILVASAAAALKARADANNAAIPSLNIVRRFLKNELSG